MTSDPPTIRRERSAHAEAMPSFPAHALRRSFTFARIGQPSHMGRRLLSKLIEAADRATLRADSGAAIAETAVMMPVILLLVTGILSLGTVLYQKLLLAQAISSGGRVLAADRGDSDPCATTAKAIENAASNLTPSSISLTFVLNGTKVVSGVAASSASCTSGSSDMTSGGTASVSATYPCRISIYGVSFKTCTLSESATEVIQ